MTTQTEAIYKAALERISKSRMNDFGTLHPDGCAAEAKEALHRASMLSATPPVAYAGIASPPAASADAVRLALVQALDRMVEAQHWHDERLGLPQMNAAIELARAALTAPVAGLASVAADLAAKQEPLGAEFSKVLHDNLSEMYILSEAAPVAGADASPSAMRERAGDHGARALPRDNLSGGEV